MPAEKIHLSIAPQLERIYDAIHTGHCVWGGGATLSCSEIGPYRTRLYTLSHANEEGGDGTEFFNTPTAAVWALLRFIGGQGPLTISPSA